MLGSLLDRATDSTLFKEWAIDLGNMLSIAIETNGKGFLGWIVELPGAFVRGGTEEEALAKVDIEVKSYLRWLELKHEHCSVANIVQRHPCSLMVEDADSEILLEEDRSIISPVEFESLAKIAVYSAKTFLTLYREAKFKDWIDEARVRSTFYSKAPKTIREIFNHVKRTQYYYLSRTGMNFDEREENFMKIRRFCLEKIKQLFIQYGNSQLFDIDNEKWTLKKILRRFVWHDRIHGKAIVRILVKQKELGIISEYSDPFYFSFH